MDHENDLPLTGSHWGTYRAKIKNGKIEKLLGWENDTDPSPIGSGILDIHNNSTRIDAPMVRKSWLESGPGSKNNLRGVDSYIAVSWDEAEKLIADELNRVRNNFGNSSLSSSLN